VDGYFKAGSFFEDRDLSWSNRGGYEYTSTPLLKDGMDEGFLFWNVTYGFQSTYWTRVLVRVTRPQPVGAKAKSLMPIDVREDRERTPLWHADGNVQRFHGPSSMWTDADKNMSVTTVCTVADCLVAQAGSYMEALVPYEFRFVPHTAAGDDVTPGTGLDGWQVTGVIDRNDVGRNKVLTVAEDSEGRPLATNLESSPYYTSSLLSGVSPSATDKVFFLRFRLFSN
jgi:hypothetical protein